MDRLARAAEVVVLARELNELDRPAEDLERLVLLQRLGDRRSRVGVAVQQEQRRVHVGDVRER